MNTSPTTSLSGRVDIHRLEELRALGHRPLVDASGIEFLDIYALGVLEELGAAFVAPSDVVRLTLELIRSSLPCLSSEAAVGALVGAA